MKEAAGQKTFLKFMRMQSSGAKRGNPVHSGRNQEENSEACGLEETREITGFQTQERD